MSVRQNGVIIAGSGSGSVDVDNSTITTNAMDEIQAVATINANTAAGATNPVYDWVGTLAEHQAQNIETLHPDWICYITDDVSGGTSVYTKSEVDTLLAGKANTATTLAGYGITDGANTALSNITNSGKEVIAHNAMPSSRYINLTLGASGTSYTAPADGYIYLCKTATAVNQNITIINDSNNMRVSDSAPSSGFWIATYLPVSKGQSIRITYTTGGITNTFRFVYANGAQ